MEVDRDCLKEEKRRLLRRLAEIEVEEQRRRGTFKSVPHYSVLEQAAHGLGQELSRLTQERAVAEVAAVAASRATCPKCGRDCEVVTRKRTVTSLDGPIEAIESVASCPACRRDFFPSA